MSKVKITLEPEPKQDWSIGGSQKRDYATTIAVLKELLKEYIEPNGTIENAYTRAVLKRLISKYENLAKGN